MIPLRDIAARHDTDKGNEYHTFNGISYLDVYDFYWGSLRDKATCVFEIGVRSGGSLKMWKEYFPKAWVWGMDINPETNKYYGIDIQVVVGSQDDPIKANEVAPFQEFDVVIDDGSHVLDHVLASFAIFWPRVRKGGWYAIEDVALGYSDISFSQNQWPGQHLNPPSTNFQNDRKKLDAVLFEAIQRMDSRMGQVQSMHFHSNQILIQKTL